MADSFPASDPPSFSGGNHIVGAPANRESESPAPDHPAVVEAEKKVKQGDAKTSAQILTASSKMPGCLKSPGIF